MTSWSPTARLGSWERSCEGEEGVGVRVEAVDSTLERACTSHGHGGIASERFPRVS